MEKYADQRRGRKLKNSPLRKRFQKFFLNHSGRAPRIFLRVAKGLQKTRVRPLQAPLRSGRYATKPCASFAQNLPNPIHVF
ncbi:hypothetical protein DLM76_19710 [Leptospira yasudae]|uniref:Uncharacterized protein n=1 Tax=Leptospira yasudae TaxID=2202201 RepID=A0ABX9LYT5_9LEPT|nr:hypothetical protein DLM77_18615 [Leptospira yasudae]RHX91053.1 hypothetical protein DLM76_19710 [Leptospira yasudae]